MAEQSRPESPTAGWWALSAMTFWLVLTIVVSFWWPLDKWRVASDPDQLPEGIGVFALFYVAAQLIERLLEAGVFWYDSIRARAKAEGVIGKFRRPKALRLVDLTGARIQAELQPTKDATTKLTEAELAVDKATKDRLAFFWGFAAFLGVVTAIMFELRFLSVVGVTFTSEVGERWDVFATAIVVGGGTQVLHGLIGKVKSPSTTP